MSHPTIRYAKTVDGLHIAFQVVGDGPTDLVYAPGWFSNLEAIWEMPDLGFLRELAGAFRLILLDRRGFGLSDWPITTTDEAEEWWRLVDRAGPSKVAKNPSPAVSTSASR